MKRLLIGIVWVCLLPTGQVWAQTLNPAYQQLLEKMYRKSVPLISVPEAARLQAQNKQVVFLDTREAAEYQVSHIQNARWVGYRNFDIKKVAGISRKTLLVVYCSVGYRSERIGEKLLRAGYTQVHNLYGSLFEWVNQGYPVYNSQQVPTTQVHAYSRSWGRWLHKGIKVY